MVFCVAKQSCWEERKSQRKDLDQPQSLENEAGRPEPEGPRDEFAPRLKAKDHDQTKRAVEDQTSKLTPDPIQRRYLENHEQARKTAMPKGVWRLVQERMAIDDGYDSYMIPERTKPKLMMHGTSITKKSVIEKSIAEVRKLTGSEKIASLPQYLHEAASNKDGGTIGCTKH
ncbi:hypothetical protein O181_080943 [Austropuccinia psidii MF-1]|uniref:Uncharacterized protein n=1 Tax=Austropuccinia psidii MF-1 TaxID=1389203 RepID=A0A9Q3FNW1_9BASI|nr:hypothetical protein [Austropuccinia psidii MF-1]